MFQIILIAGDAVQCNADAAGIGKMIMVEQRCI